MKIAYKNGHMTINLIFGLVWLIWFFIQILTKDEPHWTNYGWIVISAIYLIGYSYQRQNGYLTIKNGIIKVNDPFGKKLKLSEIRRIKKFAGDYILKSDTKVLSINTQIIAPDSLAILDAELESLSVEPN